MNNNNKGGVSGSYNVVAILMQTEHNLTLALKSLARVCKSAKKKDTFHITKGEKERKKRMEIARKNRGSRRARSARKGDSPLTKKKNSNNNRFRNGGNSNFRNYNSNTSQAPVSKVA